MELSDYTDKFSDECGVFGVHDHQDAASLCILGLHSLQHRGQESFGVVSYCDDGFCVQKYQGHVFSVSHQKMNGRVAIGHVRYSTSGGLTGIQPFCGKTKFGEVAVAHNGNLINTAELQEILIKRGCILQSNIDTETILHLISISNSDDFLAALTEALQKIKGAYSLIIINNDVIYGVRDPHGIRPLSIGLLGDNSYVLSSETCAFDAINAKLIRDVQPGELVRISKNGVSSSFPMEQKKSSFCIFEYIYFARPDSFIDGRSVYYVRKNIGATLANEHPVDCLNPVVVPVPDSGMPAAIGYAQESGLQMELGIIRSHYVGRTFIQPTDATRKLGVQLKHNANSAVVKNRDIILIDDSIVRGTTLKNIVALIKNAGAKSVHIRISSPPTVGSCFYGIDTPDKDKLLAVRMAQDDMRIFLGADSLEFISINGLYRAVCGQDKNEKTSQYCDACFTSFYPVD